MANETTYGQGQELDLREAAVTREQPTAGSTIPGGLEPSSARLRL